MIAEDLARLGADSLLSILLPGETDAPGTHEPQRLELDPSTELVALCQNNRLAPILGDAVNAGRLVLANGALPELFTAIEHYLASQLRVELQGMAVIDALIAEGIDFRMMKGMATGYLDYSNPAMRPIGDLDILIRTSDMTGAIKTLATLEGGAFQIQPGNDWRVTHALPLQINGIEIDLHNRLLHQAAGHCAAHFDLFADPAQYEIGGRELFALPAWLRLLQAASQNVLGDYVQLSSDLDVARLAAYVDEALERASQVGLGWVVAEGVRRSQQNLGWGPPLARLERMTWRDRCFRRSYGGGKSSIFERSVLELATAKPANAAAIVRATLRPGDEYLERRGRSTTEQISRQFDRLRQLGQ